MQIKKRFLNLFILKKQYNNSISTLEIIKIKIVLFLFKFNILKNNLRIILLNITDITNPVTVIDVANNILGRTLFMLFFIINVIKNEDINILIMFNNKVLMYFFKMI